MRTKIYQINSKRDVNRVKFEGLDLLERYQGSSAVDPSIYDEVFSAEIDETDLEQIYQRFNTVGHLLRSTRRRIIRHLLRIRITTTKYGTKSSAEKRRAFSLSK